MGQRKASQPVAARWLAGADDGPGQLHDEADLVGERHGRGVQGDGVRGGLEGGHRAAGVRVIPRGQGGGLRFQRREWIHSRITGTAETAETQAVTSGPLSSWSTGSPSR